MGKIFKKLNNSDIYLQLMTSVISICLCMVCLTGMTWAWFTASISAPVVSITTGRFDVDVTVTPLTNTTEITDNPVDTGDKNTQGTTETEPGTENTETSVNTVAETPQGADIPQEQQDVILPEAPQDNTQVRTEPQAKEQPDAQQLIQPMSLSLEEEQTPLALDLEEGTTPLEEQPQSDPQPQEPAQTPEELLKGSIAKEENLVNGEYRITISKTAESTAKGYCIIVFDNNVDTAKYVNFPIDINVATVEITLEKPTNVKVISRWGIMPEGVEEADKPVLIEDELEDVIPSAEPSPTTEPTASAEPTATVDPTPTVDPSASPESSPSVSPEVTPTVSPEASTSPSQEPSASPEATEGTPAATPAVTVEPTASNDPQPTETTAPSDDPQPTDELIEGTEKTPDVTTQPSADVSPSTEPTVTAEPSPQTALLRDPEPTTTPDPRL